MSETLIDIEGIDEVCDMLTALPKAVVARAFLKALQAGANVIANAVETRIPMKVEDTGGIIDKGVLRESLMIATELDADFRGGVAEIGFGNRGADHVANWLEYGHRMVGHEPDKKLLGSVQAHPFMRPATEVSAERAIDAFSDTLMEELKAEGVIADVA